MISSLPVIQSTNDIELTNIVSQAKEYLANPEAFAAAAPVAEAAPAAAAEEKAEEKEEEKEESDDDMVRITSSDNVCSFSLTADRSGRASVCSTKLFWRWWLGHVCDFSFHMYNAHPRYLRALIVLHSIGTIDGIGLRYLDDVLKFSKRKGKMEETFLGSVRVTAEEVKFLNRVAIVLAILEVVGRTSQASRKFRESWANAHCARRNVGHGPGVCRWLRIDGINGPILAVTDKISYDARPQQVMTMNSNVLTTTTWHYKTPMPTYNP